MSKTSSDFERLESFLRSDMWSSLRTLRRYFLTYEKRWLYLKFVQINLQPTSFDTFLNYFVSINWMTDLIMLNLALIVGSSYMYGIHFYGRVLFNTYTSLLLHAFGLFPSELPPNRLDQRLIPRARSLLGGYACQDTWILVSCVSGILIEMSYATTHTTTTATTAFMSSSYDMYNVAIVFFLCSYVVLFGYSRVWALARFHHTVVMGMVGGLLGNVLYSLFHEYFNQMSSRNTVFAATGATVGLLLWLMINIESNNANGFGIPKQEYLRVLGDIMNTDATVTMGGGDDRSQQIASQRARQAVLRQRREINKKDGFVRMLERIEQRSSRELSERDGGGGGVL